MSKKEKTNDNNEEEEQPAEEEIEGTEEEEPEIDEEPLEETGDQEPGAEEAPLEEPGEQEPGTEEAPLEETGDQEPGAEEAPLEEPGEQEPGTEEAPLEETGDQEPGTEEAPLEETGDQEPGTEEAPLEETGDQEPGTEESGQEGYENQQEQLPANNPDTGEIGIPTEEVPTREQASVSENIEPAVENASENEKPSDTESQTSKQEPTQPPSESMEAQGQTEPQETMIIVAALSKAGSLTVPKEVRDALKLDPGKKFKFTWDKANRLLFEIVPDNEIIEIEQRIEAEKEKKVKKVESKKPKKGKTTGPEMEFGKYLGYDFDGSAKLQPILEKSFEQFLRDPPNIEEALKFIKYALISLTGENNIVNSKLRFTLVNYICDIVEKFNQPFLLDYAFENVIKDIKSKFLHEQSLVQIAVTSFKKRPEKCNPIIQMVLKKIDDYPAVEIYNIINSFDLLSRRLSEAKFPSELTQQVRDKILEKVSLMTDRDYKMQAIRQLARLRYFDDAIRINKEILAAMADNESGLGDVRDLLKEIEDAARPEERKWKSEEEMDVLDVDKLSKDKPSPKKEQAEEDE